MTRPAVFLDRDGTVIRDVNYIARADQVELLPDAAAAIKRLGSAGLRIVIVTNQSGIARGMFTTADYERVQREVESQLRAAGATIDATYMCPHHPEFGGACECRKPGTLLFRRAAAEHDIDLMRSWFIGDRIRDVIPARVLGGHGILVPGADTPADDVTRARAEFEVAASLDEAVARVVQSAQ